MKPFASVLHLLLFTTALSRASEEFCRYTMCKYFTGGNTKDILKNNYKKDHLVSVPFSKPPFNEHLIQGDTSPPQIFTSYFPQ